MKNKYSIIKLHFKSPVHISSGGSGYENSEELIHSDTLFSSICSTAKLLYGDEKVEKLLESENLFISSAFPFFKENYFFPRPLGYFKEFERYEDEKTFKKVKYFSKEIFEKIINELPLNNEFNKKGIVNGCYSEDLNSDRDALYRANEVPRVTIDRITNSTLIFHFSEVSFSKESGLYFILSCDDLDLRRAILSSIKLLGDEGIGADNTIGKGLFEIEETELDLNVPEESGKRILLSLYNPKEEELKEFEVENSKYNFITRRGWISSHSNMNLRRKSVRMLIEGSILKFKNKLIPKGRIINVLDKNDLNFLTHNIYRSGKVFTIPVR